MISFRVWVQMALFSGLPLLHAQTSIDLRTQTKSVDFSSAVFTKPSKVGTALPPACLIGETFFNSAAPAGHNFYGCTTTNTWSLLGANLWFGGGSVNTGDCAKFDSSGNIVSAGGSCSTAAADVVKLFAGCSGTQFLAADGACHTVSGGSGSGYVVLTTGAGAPAPSCAAPSTTNLAVYLDTTNEDEWWCYATNAWKKMLSVTGSGPYVIAGATGPAPTAPSSGSVSCYFDSTTNTKICLDSSGNAFTMVKGIPAAAHQFLTNVDAAGIQHAAALALGDLPALTATQVGLGNVDNTADINKAISTAAATALALKAPLNNPVFTGPVTAGNMRWFSVGTDSLMMGSGAGNLTSTPDRATGVGSGALGSIVGGTLGTAFGAFALTSVTTGGDNVGIGAQAGYGVTTGAENVFLGTSVGYFTQTGNDNTALGHHSYEYGGDASENTAVGSRSLQGGLAPSGKNVTGGQNTAIGTNSLLNDLSGTGNTAVGWNSLSSNMLGSYSTSVGWHSLNDSDGTYNAAFGVNSGWGNTVTGYSNTSGTYNTFLGANTKLATATQRDHLTVIGADANGDCSNCVVLGRPDGSDEVHIPGTLFAPPGGMVPAWGKYSLAKIANGSGGCTNANGCWSVNGGLAVPAAAATTQDITAFPMNNGYLESARIKTSAACTGATTITMGLGVPASPAFYRANTYDLKVAAGAFNFSDTLANSGNATAGNTPLNLTIATTGSNVDQIVSGCAVDVWIKWTNLR